MHHIDICLENGYFLTKNQNSLSIGHKKKKKEGNSTGKGKEMIKNENVRKNGKSKSIDLVDQLRTNQRVRRGWEF